MFSLREINSVKPHKKKKKGSRDGAVVRTFVSHQCAPRRISVQQIK